MTCVTGRHHDASTHNGPAQTRISRGGLAPAYAYAGALMRGHHLQFTMNQATFVSEDTALLKCTVNELAETLGTADWTYTPVLFC